MNNGSIYSSREKLIEKRKKSKSIKRTDTDKRIRRSGNSGLRRLKHKLKNQSLRYFYTIFGFTLIALILVFSWFYTFRN